MKIEVWNKVHTPVLETVLSASENAGSLPIVDVDQSTLQFESFADLLKHFQDRANVEGTMIGRDTHNFTEKQWGIVFPGLKFRKFVSYGFLYCIMNSKIGAENISCQNGKFGNRKSSCKWTVHFRFDRPSMKYVVTGHNLEHSHPVNLHLTLSSERRVISYEKEMTDDEIDYTKAFGSAMLVMPKVWEIMRLKFPGRDFDATLLHRLLRNGHAEHFGEDPDMMNSMYDLGNDIVKGGGIFQFRRGPDDRMTDLFVMKSSMGPKSAARSLCGLCRPLFLPRSWSSVLKIWRPGCHPSLSKNIFFKVGREFCW